MSLPFVRYRVVITLTRRMLATNPMDPNVMDKHILERQRKLILDQSAVNREINKYLNAPPISDARGKEQVARLAERLSEIIGEPLTDEQQALLVAGKLEELKETFAGLAMTGTTVFFTDPATKRPCVGDYMIYGFLKASAEALGRTLPKKNSTVLQSISYTQSLINQHVRCESDFIVFDRDSLKDDAGATQFTQRSLRAKTAQGDRITLSKSEVMPAGGQLDFVLKILPGSPLLSVVECHGKKAGVLEHLFDYGEMVGLGQWRNAGNGMFEYEMHPVSKVPEIERR